MKPAATVNCNHVCPMFDGNKPHVGGPVSQGAGKTFIGNKPAACQGHQLRCNSPAAPVIQSGSSTVFIEGRPAARMGDPTSHGGTIIEGSATVFIGG